jgi:hypothetical protein
MVTTATPTITVTMLGATRSGKSTFMLGMYAMLAGGIHGYFAHAAHDEHLQLIDQWDRLYDEGKLPPPTAERPRDYRFTFMRDIEELLNIDWLDYRGGALSDTASTADTAQLLTRMAESDSVYLVLDGTKVARWVRLLYEAAVAHGPLPETGQIRREMRIEDMTSMLMQAIRQRREAGKRPPSLVVVITKMDTLTSISQLGEDETIGLIRDYLQDLLGAAYAAGVTTLLQPVQLGTFGTTTVDVVDRDSVAPRDLHKPFIFTYLTYLRDRIDEDNRRLETVQSQRLSVENELQVLRSRLISSVFRRSRLDQLTRRQNGLAADTERLRSSLHEMQERVRQLAPDLQGAWIIRDGTPGPRT